ncbi:MAG: DNA polymerase III subunit delta [Verrucomicrobiae bacterium]|nr:DNA polymerase III subunit delta [Verrucomicrobiae bacterium]
MPASAVKPAPSVLLVCGEDEFAVKQRARQVYQQWTESLGGMDHEIIEAMSANSGEALKAIARLREALQTLPFFGSGKAVWLRDCNFLGDERAAQSQAVTETLTELAQELKSFAWQNVRLLVSAGKVDKRKVFYKTLDRIGSVESLDGWSVNDRDWVSQAENWGVRAIQTRGKTIADDALAELIARIGSHARQLDSEIEKLCLYVGERDQINATDVEAICTRNKTARAFALGDALGDRNLPGLLARLDEELWEMQFDRDKSEIGLLYGLIGKMRALLLLKEMIREGWVKPTQNYQSFKQQLERVPAAQLPADRRYNPLALNPYVLFKALSQTQNYTEAELVSAMDSLLRCNQRLVSSGLDDTLVLQQTLVQIIGPGRGRSAVAAARR